MKHTRRPWWRLMTLLAVAGLLAGACGDDGGDTGEGSSTDTSFGQSSEEENGEDENVTASHGGSISVGLEAESTGWTPGESEWVGSGLTVAYSIYDPLVSLSAEGEYEPYLAESIEPNEDLTEWTLTLRDGVTFHDGSPLDAETLKWNFDTLLSGADRNTSGALQTAGVTDMVVDDELTVTYQLSAPNAALPDLLRGVIGMPASRQAYEADPEGFNSNPVGTGPFVFESWVRDGSLVVTRNADYWRTDDNDEQLPYLDRIEFRPISDEESRAISLESDDVQVMHTLRGSTAQRVLDVAADDSRNVDVLTRVGNNSGAAVFNTLEPPVDDVRVRRALAMASDGQQVAEVLGDAALVPRSTGFFSEDSPWYSEEAANTYPGTAGRDVEAATALIDEYKNDPERSDGRAPGEGVTLTYQCLPDPSLIAVAQLQQALWSEAGVDVELRQVDQSTLVSNAVGTADQDPPWRGDFVATCFRSPELAGDPLTDFQTWFGPVEASPTNFSNFTHPEIDEALDTLRTTQDFDERYEAVEQIQIIAAQNVPIAFSSGTPTLVGFRDDVHGLSDWTLPSGAEGSGITGSVMRFHEVFLAEG